MYKSINNLRNRIFDVKLFHEMLNIQQYENDEI